MKRRVEFSDNGDIIMTGEMSRDVVKAGVVLLTFTQAELAARYGWKIEGRPEMATEPWLYRVRR